MVLKPPKESSSIVKQIIKQVEQSLINRQLKPGDRFPSENELIQSLGVSKASVREAVKMLEALGVLDVRRGEGAFVRTTPQESSINPMIYSIMLETPNDTDIFELRMMFEPAYTLLAMNKATDEDLKDIEEKLNTFIQKVELGTFTGEDDLDFHRSILKATHNQYVIRIGNTILDLFSVSIEKSVQHASETAVHDHKQIFAALTEKDPVKLNSAVVKSFDGWMQNYDI